MPPVNDNFGGSLISGASGSISGTNVGATGQVGEPTNYGRTVWYFWTCPALSSPSNNTGQCVFFSTANNANTTFRTVIRAFTGSSVSALTEVTYVSSAAWNTRYAGWDYGSLIAFDATPGTTYHIQVDGQFGDQGTFQLVWGEFFNTLLLGNCDGCPPFLNDVCKCVGTVQMTSAIGGPQTLDFGTIGTGYYIGTFCGGCLCYDDGSNSAGVQSWGMYTQNATSGPCSPFAGPLFTWNYFAGGSPASTVFASTSGNQNFPSQPDCELFNICVQVPMAHSGGDIHIAFTDCPYSDNTVHGNPNPIFGLYQCPQLEISSACASWTTPCVAATCAFDITNIGGALTGVTATLNATGGITSPSAPQTGVFLPNGTTTLTFTFNASTPNVTATLVLTGSGGSLPQTLTVFLGPIIQASVFSFSELPSCGGCARVTFDVANVGYWTITPNVDITMSDPALFFFNNTSSCTNIGTTLSTPSAGTAPCNNTSSFHIATVVKLPAATEIVNFSLHVYDSCADYGISIVPQSMT